MEPRPECSGHVPETHRLGIPQGLDSDGIRKRLSGPCVLNRTRLRIAVREFQLLELEGVPFDKPLAGCCQWSYSFDHRAVADVGPTGDWHPPRPRLGRSGRSQCSGGWCHPGSPRPPCHLWSWRGRWSNTPGRPPTATAAERAWPVAMVGVGAIQIRLVTLRNVALGSGRTQ